MNITNIQDRTGEFRAIFQKTHHLPGPEQNAGRDSKEPTVCHSKANELLRNISRSIGQIHDKLNRLAVFAGKRSLYGDRPSEIQELTEIIKQDMGSCTKAISKLQEHVRKLNSSSSKNRQRHHNSMIESLRNRLKEATARFKSVLETRTHNLKAARQRRNHYAGQGYNHGGAADALTEMPTLSAPPPTQDDVAIDMGLSQEMAMYQDQDTYVSQRAEAMQNIESTLAELGTIFQQLAEMIQQQGEKVERIDQNVEEVSINVDAAHNELLTYYQSISSNRMLMLKVFGVLLVFFILFVVVLA